MYVRRACERAGVRGRREAARLMDLYMVRTCAWAGDMVLVISRVAYMEDEDLLAEILERYNGRGGYLNAVDEIVANGPRERPARPSLPPPPLLLPPHPPPYSRCVIARCPPRTWRVRDKC
eukprot:jgi/Mesvir1/26052/Mv05024-RA.1